MRQVDDGELELRDYLKIARRRWRWILAPLLLVPLFAWYTTSRQTEVWQATARVLLANSAAQDAIQGGNTNSFTVSRQLANEINLAESDSTKSEVRSRLDLAKDDDLPSGTIEAESGSDVLNFVFTGKSPEDAARFANTWAEVYVDVKQQTAQDSITRTVTTLEGNLEELRSQRSEIRSELEDLEDRLARATVDAQPAIQAKIDREASAISGDLNLIDARIASNIDSITKLQLDGELAAQGTATVYQTAAEPQKPTNAPLSRNLILAVFVGSILGVAAALLAENLDQTVSSHEEIEALGLTPLGSIPKASRELKRTELALIGHDRPEHAISDGYQKVRTALQFTVLDSGIRSIVVSSPLQGDGKTTTSVNLALAFASVDRQVVLVDADLRRPRIHSVFATALRPGLTDALVGNIPLNEVAVRFHASPDNLAALPAGTQPPNPSTFLSSPGFAALAKDLRASSDLVIYDAPPILPVSDALSVSQHADGVVLVASSGITKAEDLSASAAAIVRAGSKVLGVVLVGAGDNDRYGKYGRYTPTADGDVPRLPSSGRNAEGSSVNGSAIGNGTGGNSNGSALGDPIPAKQAQP